MSLPSELQHLVIQNRNMRETYNTARNFFRAFNAFNEETGRTVSKKILMKEIQWSEKEWLIFDDIKRKFDQARYHIKVGQDRTFIPPPLILPSEISNTINFEANVRELHQSCGNFLRAFNCLPTEGKPISNRQLIILFDWPQTEWAIFNKVKAAYVNAHDKITFKDSQKNSRVPGCVQYFWKRIYSSAYTNNTEIQIDREELYAMKFDWICVYCKSSEGYSPDRKDSNECYTIDNTVTACAPCNMMKAGHLPIVFIEHSRAIILHQQDPNFSALQLHHPNPISYESWSRQCKRSVHISKELYTKLVNTRCYYCGAIPLNGIDRKDNALDYTEENSVPCCCACNFMKLTYSVEVFLYKCAERARHNPPVSFSSETICKVCNRNKANCYGTGFCCECYWHTHVCHSRPELKRRKPFVHLSKRQKIDESQE